MAKVVIWASGFRWPYHTESEEIKSYLDGAWSPSSKDFKAAAERSGDVAFGAATIAELLKGLAKQKAGSITQLGIIGHSNDEEFGLAGDIITTKPMAPNVTFKPTGAIDADVLKANSAAIARVNDRFADDATLTLFSCHAGSSSFLVSWADAFNVQIVEGFAEEIQTNFSYSSNKLHVTSRGRMVYVQGLELIAEPFKSQILTTAMVTKVWALEPDSGCGRAQEL
jgi:hypothetical protein